MDLVPYKKLIALTKDAARSLLATPRAKEMRLKAELEIAKTESDIVSKEQKLQEIGAEYPINFDKLLATIDEIGLLERRKKILTKVINEMFPD